MRSFTCLLAGACSDLSLHHRFANRAIIEPGIFGGGTLLMCEGLAYNVCCYTDSPVGGKTTASDRVKQTEITVNDRYIWRQGQYFFVGAIG